MAVFFTKYLRFRAKLKFWSQVMAISVVLFPGLADSNNNFELRSLKSEDFYLDLAERGNFTFGLVSSESKFSTTLVVVTSVMWS